MRIVDILCQQRERSTYQREREIVEELTTPNKRALVQDWWVELLYYYNYNATFTLSKLDRGL